MRIVVVGATGLIGRHLVTALGSRGDDVVAVTRRATTLEGRDSYVWDPSTGAPPSTLLDSVDAIVNLAGAPIAPGRWTAARRASIHDSRVGTTQLLVSAMAGHHVSVLVNASAVGFYGASEQPVGEQAPPGRGFLADLCVEWEQAASSAPARVVIARMGVVLDRDGGAFPVLWRVARLGALGRLGDGRQWMPWIHVDDEVGALVHCLDHDLSGPVNFVAPEAVRQDALARALRHRAHRPWAPPTPAVVVRAGLGEAASLVLEGARVVPDALVSSGYAHRFATLDGALDDLVGT